MTKIAWDKKLIVGYYYIKYYGILNFKILL